MQELKLEPVFSNKLLSWIATSMLALTVVSGLLLWRPDFGGWAVVSTGILLTLMLYFVEAIVNRQNRLPSNKLHGVFLGISGIVVLHLFAMWAKITPSTCMRGSIGSSIVFHLALISAGILLVQTFAWRGIFLQYFRHISVGFLMLGCAIAGLFKSGKIGSEPLFLAGLSGLAIWSLGFIKKYTPANFAGRQNPLKDKVLKGIYLGTSILFALAFVFFSSIESFFIAMTVAIFCFSIYQLAIKYDTAKPAWIFTIIWSVIITFAIVATKPACLGFSLLGIGERGFYAVSACNSGAHIILAISGVIGVAIFIAGFFATGCWLITGAKRGFPRQIIRATLATAGICLAGGAFLSTGGFTTPISTVAIIIAGGLLYQNAGIHKYDTKNSVAQYCVKTSPAIYIVLALAAVFAVAGIAGFPGLLGEMGFAMGLSDKSLHLIAGGLISIVLAWWLGKYHWLLGLVGIGLACGVGVLGEAIQGYAKTGRGSESADVKKHLIGCAIGAGIYFASILGRFSVNDIASRKSWQPAGIKFYVGWFARTLIMIVVFVPAFIWMLGIVEFSANSNARGVPGIIVGDLVVNKQSAYYRLPARSKYQSDEIVSKLFTQALGKENLLGSYNRLDQNYIANFPLFRDWDLNKAGQFIIGDPYSKFAYVDTRDMILQTISSDDTVLILSAKDVLEHNDELTVDLLTNKLREDYGKVAKDCKLVFLHPGPPEVFANDKLRLKKRFPNIPVVCDTNYMCQENYNPKSFTIPQKESYHSAYFLYYMVCYREYKKIKNHRTGKLVKVAEHFPPTIMYVGTDLFINKYFQTRRLKKYRSVIVEKDPAAKKDFKNLKAANFMNAFDSLFMR